MRLADLDILFIPGLGNSGPDHWQSRWEKKLSTARRIGLPDWDHPHCAAWTARIVETVNAGTRPILIVAHSLGCAALAHAAPLIAPGRIKGAFLVAPAADAHIRALASVDPAFAPVPLVPLPFKSLCVTSDTDPDNATADMAALGAAWGAEVVSAGDAGHINAASGHGPWPEGLLTLAGFLRKL